MVAERPQAATAGLTPPYAVVDLAQDDQLRESIMVMVDSIEQCDLIADAAEPTDQGVHGRRRPSSRRSTAVIFYDAQIAGRPDSSPAVRTVKRLSTQELRARRREVIVWRSATLLI
jgi:hypothetical protein